MSDNWILHRAGPMIGQVQKCLDCGYVLTDCRNAMVVDGDELPCGWAEGDVSVLDGFPISFVAGKYEDAIRCNAKPS